MSAEDRPIETAQVARLVEEYVESEKHDEAQYSNRSPLDESGIFSLHLLAARIYQLGFHEGRFVEATMNDAERRRARQKDDA